MLTVFVQYYVAKNPARAAELNECFKKNIENTFITTLIIFFEVEADMALIPDYPKIIKRYYPHRMTYGYWLRETDKLPVGTLSFLINSDIYLTESVTHLIVNKQVILDDKKFVAISRYNPEGDTFVLNKDPHWTQDVWGLAKGATAFPNALYQEAAFELGQPACDNKIAYVMHSYGFNVTNPCYKVKTIHLQADDNTRSYDPKISKLVGLQAYIYPSESVVDNSALDFDLLTRSKTDMKEIRVNNWINNRKSYVLQANELHMEPGAAYIKPPIFGAQAEHSSVSNAVTSVNPDEMSSEHVKELNLEDSEKYILRSQFNPKFYREVVRFSDRFIVYDDIETYCFYDKFWPIVRKISKSEVKFSDVSKTNFHFFALGFLPASISLGVVDMSNEMQYDEDVLFWQYPCRTEADAYEAHQLISGAHIEGNLLDTYVALPWATFVDKKTFPEGIIGLYSSRIKAAKEIGQNLGFTVRVHTVCQHVFWRDIQPYFERVGVTNLWISHKEPALNMLGESIYLHAWPLYAVNYLDPKRRSGMRYIPAPQKPIFASFIGAHMKHYLSDVRLKLRELSDKPGFHVQIKDEWHFNKEVYNFQVYGQFAEKDSSNNSETERYNDILSQSLFSLCPVGAGPNSLRFWESLANGSIPVSLSDRFQLPPLDKLDPSNSLRWEDAIVFHSENDVSSLETRLRSYTPEQLQSLQDTGRSIFKKVRNYVCFGQITRPEVNYEESKPIDPQDLELVELFKPQQIHVTESTYPVFDGICEPVKAIFELNESHAKEHFEALIYFDQTERMYAVLLDAEFSSNCKLEVEVLRMHKYNVFISLADPQILNEPGSRKFLLNPDEVQTGMGLKLRMKVIAAENTVPTVKVSISFELFKNYFAKTMREFDRLGQLKYVSDTNYLRKDLTLDTLGIESGFTLSNIPKVIKIEECKEGNYLFPYTPPAKTNLIGEQLSDGVSMYVHLMNRNENVKANLSNWLTQKFDELVLLDWSSKDPVADIPGVFDDPRVRVVRVEGQEKFIRTLAQNLASRVVRNRLIFKCDSDVLFKGDFFASHPLKQGEFWVGDWHQARDFNERHLHGETFYHIDDFYRVHGYDERIMAYGHDDTNLKDRMVLAGMVKKVFSYNQLLHIPHPQELRATNQDMIHPMVKTYENRIASRNLPVWTSSNPLLSFTRVILESPTEAQKSNREILFTADEKRTSQADSVIEDEAITVVSAWYASQEALAKMSREEKIKLIWEKQVE
jgi:hypothetical protein